MSKEEIMYVEGKPVYEGDKLLYRGEDGEQYIRKVYHQHKLISISNPKWINNWSWDLDKPKQR